MEKKGILIVSFGTTYSDTRRKTIEVIERELSEQFPDRIFYRAFTSDIVRNVIYKKEGITIFNVSEALEEMYKEGITDILVQPTHIIAGMENDKMLLELEKRKDKFASILVGRPLLDKKEDYEAAARAVLAEVKKQVNLTEDMAMILMGHGSEHEANKSYSILQAVFREMGYGMIYVSTVEGSPSFRQTMLEIKEKKYQTIVLQPFMIVSGDHVRNDMASKQANSWKSQLEELGYETICLVKGLGELKEIRQQLLLHTKKATKI